MAIDPYYLWDLALHIRLVVAPQQALKTVDSPQGEEFSPDQHDVSVV